MGWPIVVAAGIAALASIGGMISDSSKSKKALREQRKSRESQERIAMEQLGLKREEMNLLEKQRGFNRLKDLVSASSQTRNNTRGWQRLSNIRTAR